MAFSLIEKVFDLVRKNAVKEEEGDDYAAQPTLLCPPSNHKTCNQAGKKAFKKHVHGCLKRERRDRFEVVDLKAHTKYV